MPQIPDDEIPEVACHGVARWSYIYRKRKYRSEYKKRDVAGKFNILTKSGADISSRLGATAG